MRRWEIRYYYSLQFFSCWFLSVFILKVADNIEHGGEFPEIPQSFQGKRMVACLTYIMSLESHGKG